MSRVGIWGFWVFFVFMFRVGRDIGLGIGLSDGFWGGEDMIWVSGLDVVFIFLVLVLLVWFWEIVFCML